MGIFDLLSFAPFRFFIVHYFGFHIAGVRGFNLQSVRAFIPPFARLYAFLKARPQPQDGIVDCGQSLHNLLVRAVCKEALIPPCYKVGRLGVFVLVLVLKLVVFFQSAFLVRLRLDVFVRGRFVRLFPSQLRQRIRIRLYGFESLQNVARGYVVIVFGVKLYGKIAYSHSASFTARLRGIFAFIFPPPSPV